MLCTRCDGTGFLNVHQVDDDTLRRFDETGDHAVVLAWIAERANRMEGGCTCAVSHPPCAHCESQHDVSVCDCCGDGDGWYGERGHHDLTDKSAPFPKCY